MIDYLIELLKKFAEIVPLPIFTFLGALVEEVIAPIPSPVVMTLAGSFAAAEQQSILYLVFLAFVGTIGKTIGMFIVYIVSRTFENVVTNKFGKFIGITDKQVEKISAKRYLQSSSEKPLKKAQSKLLQPLVFCQIYRQDCPK